MKYSEVKSFNFSPLIAAAILFFLFSPSNAQDSSKLVDSLYKNLQQTVESKVRLQLLAGLVREIHYSDSAQPYYLEAISLARELNNSRLLAENLNRLGVYYRNKNLQDESLLYYEEALAVSKQADDYVQIGHSLNNIGQIYYLQGLFDEALNYYTDAEYYFQTSGDLYGLAYNLTGKSLVLGALGQYLNALEAINTAISIRSTNGNSRQLIVSKFNKAQLLIDMGDLDAAKKDVLALYEYGLEYDYFRALQALEQLVVIEQKNRNFTNLKKYVDEALILHNQRPNSESIIAILTAAIEVATLEKNDNWLSELEELLAEEKKEYNTQKVRDYLAKLTIQRQKREIEQLNRENELKLKAEKFRNYIFILLFVMKIILLSLVILYRRYLNHQRKLNQDLKVQKIKIEAQAKELVQINQVKDKILSILSHDLRGPLQSLQGMLDLINLKYLTQEEFQTYIPQISVDLGNNVLLLENLLLWSKNQMQGMQINKSKFDLSEMICKNFQLIQASSNYKQQDLKNKVPEGTEIYADKNMIEIVLRNLLNNALKFTNNGEQILVNSRDHSDNYWICVEDKGVGMNQIVKNKLFKNDFYTTLGTNNEGGTGLGLIISKDLIEHNKGTLWVESEEGIGSKFIFTVPKH
ncbi:ATP-binding protein [Mongoliitalea lutea]|nr:tetratricopeptide repeat-containing sensor histidine kinase [Mongoliitalea lutea]